MSYDYAILNTSETLTNTKDLKEDDLKSFGTADEVKKIISETFPNMKWESRGDGLKSNLWGYIFTTDLRLEVNILEKRLYDDDVTKITWIAVGTSFHQDVSCEVKKMARALGGKALDMQKMVFI